MLKITLSIFALICTVTLSAAPAAANAAFSGWGTQWSTGFKLAPPAPDPVPDPVPDPDPEPDPEPDPQPEPPAIHNRGMVSLSFDDGLLSTYERALPVMKNYGFAGTVYVYPRQQDEKQRLGGGYESFMSWAQVEELQNQAQWEIGNHSYSHAHLTQLSLLGMRQEIDKALQSFAKHNIDISGLAAPYGEYNDDVLAYVARNHAYQRTAYGGIYNTFSNLNDYQLYAVEVSHTMTPDEAKALIDGAIAQNVWLILYWHDLVEGAPQPYQYNVDDFEEIISYLSAAETLVVPVKEGLQTRWGSGGNLVHNGGFEEGLGYDATYWKRSDPMFVRATRLLAGAYPDPARSAWIKGGTNQHQIYTDPIPVAAGKNYRMRAFMRMEKYTAGSGNVWISEYDSSNTYLGGAYLASVPDNFIGTKYADYTPSTGTSHIELYFYAAPGSKLTWHIDGVGLMLAKEL